MLKIELTPQDIDRFWNKVRISDDQSCWQWTAARTKGGYGKFGVRNALYYSHRIVLTLKLGRQIAEGMEATHTCDNPPCCNPSHIVERTHGENMDDMVQKGRDIKAAGDRSGARTRPEARSRGKKHSDTMKRVAARGEDAGSAVLTEQDVRKMREMYGAGNYTYKQLAELFGVAESAAYCAIKGKTWSHLK